jgi:hypothetical protein
LLLASETDTGRTILFGYGWPHAPHRAPRTLVEEWGESSRLRSGAPMNRSSATRASPVRRCRSIDSWAFPQTGIPRVTLHRWNCVGRPVGEIVRRIADEARAVVERCLGRP